MQPIAQLTVMEDRLRRYTGMKWGDLCAKAYGRAGDILDDAHARMIGDIAITAAIDVGITYGIMEAHLGWSFSSIKSSISRARHLMEKSIIAQTTYNVLVLPDM